MPAQMPLFGREELAFDAGFERLERTELADGAWLERISGWLRGDDQLFQRLAHATPWREEERVMYEKRVAVPRLLGSVDPRAPGLEVIEGMQRALNQRYRTAFERVSVALYRDGTDGVAWHGDYVAREMPTALVASVSLGSPRKMLLRPTGGGSSIGFTLGRGDLLVMGGTCQRTWQHAIPKVARAEARMALMFRPVWEAAGAFLPERSSRPARRTE